MADYRYRARDADGGWQAGPVQAASEAEAVEALRAAGLADPTLAVVDPTLPKRLGERRAYAPRWEELPGATEGRAEFRSRRLGLGFGIVLLVLGAFTALGSLQVSLGGHWALVVGVIGLLVVFVSLWVLVAQEHLIVDGPGRKLLRCTQSGSFRWSEKILDGVELQAVVLEGLPDARHAGSGRYVESTTWLVTLLPRETMPQVLDVFDSEESAHVLAHAVASRLELPFLARIGPESDAVS